MICLPLAIRPITLASIGIHETEPALTKYKNSFTSGSDGFAGFVVLMCLRNHYYYF